MAVNFASIFQVREDLDEYSVNNNPFSFGQLSYWFPYSSGARSATEVFEVCW